MISSPISKLERQSWPSSFSDRFHVGSNRVGSDLIGSDRVGLDRIGLSLAYFGSGGAALRNPRSGLHNSFTNIPFTHSLENRAQNRPISSQAGSLRLAHTLTCTVWLHSTRPSCALPCSS